MRGAMVRVGLRLRNCAVVIALLVASLLSRQGVATDWLNTTGMPDPWYHIGSNWDGGAAPGPNDTAIFDQTAAYEVWWDSTTASTTPDVKFLEES